MVYDWLRQGSWTAFGWFRADVAWRWYANATAVLFLGALCALALATITAGKGAVYKTEGPVTSERMTIRNGVPTMRVPVGGKLEFTMAWRVIEGGCQRYMTRTWERLDGPEPYTLSVRKRAQSHAVGRPGSDFITIDLPLGVTPGLWLYRSVAEAECPAPGRKVPPVEFARFHLEVYEPDGPVLRTFGPVSLATPKVKVGGPIAYRASWERFDATPSETYITYTRLDGAAPGPAPDVVIERRPAMNRPPGKHIDIDVSAPLPTAVGPGKWRMKQVLISTRAGGRTRTDPFLEVEFEVVP